MCHVSHAACRDIAFPTSSSRCLQAEFFPFGCGVWFSDAPRGRCILITAHCQVQRSLAIRYLSFLEPFVTAAQAC